jgi:serine/threonine-protein kinase
VAFSPDGNQIVAGGIDFTARVWNATPLASNLTAEHDARYRQKIQTLEQLKAATDDVERAKILADGGQWTMAAEALAKAVAKKPDDPKLRYQLIDALVKSGDTRRVGPACDDMLKQFGNTGDPLQNLGVAGFCRLANQAVADPQQREAVHKLVMTSDGLNRVLRLGQLGQWDLVSHGLAKIVEDKPDDASAHLNLGLALYLQGKTDEAIAPFREAIRLKPDFDRAYGYLGFALRRQGRFAESLAAFKRGHELGAKQTDTSYRRAELVREAERLAALEGKLPGCLKGEYQAKDNTERLGLAEVCQRKKLNHAAARLYTDAFAADPKAAGDLKAFHRYNAACFASLAAAGQGEDAATLNDDERTRLRQQALDWLRADLAARTKQLESGQPADRAEFQRAMQHWQQDSDLAGLRDEAPLAKLSEAERKAWQALWGEVRALLKRAE